MIIKLKYISYLFLVGAICYGYSAYTQASTYDANNPNSIHSMLMIIPSNKQAQFIDDFNQVAQGLRAINLHGMSVNEIHTLAEQTRAK